MYKNYSKHLRQNMLEFMFVHVTLILFLFESWQRYSVITSPFRVTYISDIVTYCNWPCIISCNWLYHSMYHVWPLRLCQLQGHWITLASLFPFHFKTKVLCECAACYKMLCLRPFFLFMKWINLAFWRRKINLKISFLSVFTAKHEYFRSGEHIDINLICLVETQTKICWQSLSSFNQRHVKNSGTSVLSFQNNIMEKM